MILKDTDEIFAADLRNSEYAAGYLNVAMEEDGVEGFLYALQKVARAHGMSKVASATELPRESLYRSMSDKGNPGIKPLLRVLETLGLQIITTPTGQGHAATVKRQEDCDKEPLQETGQALHERVAAELAAMRQIVVDTQLEMRKAVAQTQEIIGMLARQTESSYGQFYLSNERNRESTSLPSVVQEAVSEEKAGPMPSKTWHQPVGVKERDLQ